MIEQRRPWFEPEDFSREHRLIQRLLELRRAGRIGVVIAECGVYYIADNPLDAWGTRRRYTVEQLWEMVERIEGASRKAGITACADARPTRERVA